MATQDLTTWTEVDAGGDLTVTVPKADVVTQSNNIDNYVYDDRGAGYYSGDFDHDFELYISSVSGTNSTFYSYCIADAVTSLGNTVPRFLTYIESSSLTPYLADANTAWDAWTAGSNLALATTYYCSLARVGNTLTWDIYSDSARTTLIQSISLTIVNTAQTFRYSYAMSSNNWGDAATSSYSIQNIDYKEAVAATGTINSTLGGATSSGSGAVKVSGATNQTLSNATLAGSGSVQSVFGTINNTLGNVTSNLSGKINVSGALTKTLAGAALAGSGTVQSVIGSAAITLDNVVLSGNAKITVSASLNSTLSNTTSSASGNVAATVGSLNVTLGDIGLNSTGVITIKGTLNQTLGDVTLRGGNIVSSGMSPVSRWWHSIH